MGRWDDELGDQEGVLMWGGWVEVSRAVSQQHVADTWLHLAANKDLFELLPKIRRVEVIFAAWADGSKNLHKSQGCVRERVITFFLLLFSEQQTTWCQLICFWQKNDKLCDRE